jgi:murein DD-endopeptidase MepM/ murein hydrolase activator NlpD
MKLGQISMKTWIGLGLFNLAALSAGYFLLSAIEPPQPETEVVELPPVQKANIEDLYPFSIKPQSTLFTILRTHGVTPQEIQDIVSAAKPLYDLTRILPGTRFNISEEVSTQKRVAQIKFRMSSSEVLLIERNQETWAAQKQVEQIDTKIVTFSGVVSSSLWKSAENAQMDPNLISDLSEIFGWQVDFAREVQVGDRWRLSVEQKLIRGEPIGWGSILAAEYQKQDQTYTAILFKVDEEKAGYFAPDGSSLKRMFLKSPIKFGRITSRFSKSRFHPILQIRRPHLGVDYAAPTGTPIRAVGDGVVTYAGWQGGGGKVVKLRHNSTYSTAYKHLNGFAKSFRS